MNIKFIAYIILVFFISISFVLIHAGEHIRTSDYMSGDDHADVNAAFNIALKVKDMIDRTQKEMCTMGALIPSFLAMPERAGTVPE